MRERHPSPERRVIALAERILGLLDEGQFTATYKYAVLIALLDLCLENTGRLGEPPDTLYTGQLAEKIIDLYWPHSIPYAEAKTELVLRQNSGGQAEIVTLIRKFRAKLGKGGHASLSRARLDQPAAYDRLLRNVEWKLIEMPLPKLQRIGGEVKPFLFHIDWDDSVKVRTVRAYQNGDATDFDNRIVLKPGVGAGLVALNALLRPLIHRQWAAKLAKLNKLEESRLESFLFGAERISLEPVRAGLRDLQGNRCFYCGKPIRSASEVDHFIPWSRYPDNSIDNLVLADHGCNNNKRDYLGASDLVSTWRERNINAGGKDGELNQIAADARWETAPERTLKVARGIYGGLPEETQLWLRRDFFVALDKPAVMMTLAST